MEARKKRLGLNKYDSRIKGVTELHNLNHAGYLITLIVPLQKQIRKRFDLKAGEWELTTLSTLLIAFLRSHYKTQKVERYFFKNGIDEKTFMRQRSKCVQLGLMVKDESTRTFDLTPKGLAIVEFACRVSIRSVGILRILLEDYVTEDVELFK